MCSSICRHSLETVEWKSLAVRIGLDQITLSLDAAHQFEQGLIFKAAAMLVILTRKSPLFD